MCVCVCISEFKAAFGMILIHLLVKYEVELLTWMYIKYNQVPKHFKFALPGSLSLFHQ